MHTGEWTVTDGVGRRDPGPWLKDHDDYLQGEISYDELRRRNCERYRRAPPICGSAKLTDAQERTPLRTREHDEEERAATETREQRHRQVRRSAIAWTALTLVGITLFAVCLSMRQWLIAAIMLQPLGGSVLDALRSIHEWRRFDD